MNFETAQKLGSVLKEFRDAKGWTQEGLESKSGVALRTIQRAERGLGLNKNSLDLLAKTFCTTVERLMERAKAAGPELRVDLELVSTAQQMIRRLRADGTKNLAPCDEHSINTHFGASLIDILDVLECGKGSAIKALEARVDGVLRQIREMGFSVFAGVYHEAVTGAKGTVRKPTTVIFAAPGTDSRIHKTTKGMVLDYLIDSRRGPIARIQGESSNMYAWMRQQLLAKFDGKKRVVDFLKKQGKSAMEIQQIISQFEDEFSTSRD